MLNTKTCVGEQHGGRHVYLQKRESQLQLPSRLDAIGQSTFSVVRLLWEALCNMQGGKMSTDSARGEKRKEKVVKSTRLQHELVVDLCLICPRSVQVLKCFQS